MEAALSILLALALWARVETTKIECADKSGGGGDVVELDTANSIERLIGPIEKNLDALPDYFESRAAACDKILVSVKATAGKVLPSLLSRMSRRTSVCARSYSG